nr:hypothetical protein [Tanacetum cinerariifolium]
MSISNITISLDTNVEDTRSLTLVYGPAPPAPIPALHVTAPISSNKIVSDQFEDIDSPKGVLDHVLDSDTKSEPSEAPTIPTLMLATLASPDYTPRSDKESEPLETKPTEEDPPQTVTPPLAQITHTPSVEPAPVLLVIPYRRCRATTRKTVTLEIGKSSTTTSARILPVTGETVEQIIPLLVARLTHHDGVIDQVYDYLEQMPLEHAEEMNDDIETLHARLASTEQEIVTLHTRVGTLDKHDEVTRDSLRIARDMITLLHIQAVVTE